jgi:hypothetical protein
MNRTLALALGLATAAAVGALVVLDSRNARERAAAEAARLERRAAELQELVPASGETGAPLEDLARQLSRASSETGAHEDLSAALVRWARANPDDACLPASIGNPPNLARLGASFDAAVGASIAAGFAAAGFERLAARNELARALASGGDVHDHALALHTLGRGDVTPFESRPGLLWQLDEAGRAALAAYLEQELARPNALVGALRGEFATSYASLARGLRARAAGEPVDAALPRSARELAEFEEGTARLLVAAGDDAVSGFTLLDRLSNDLPPGDMLAPVVSYARQALRDEMLRQVRLSALRHALRVVASPDVDPGTLDTEAPFGGRFETYASDDELAVHFVGALPSLDASDLVLRLPRR